MLLACCSYSAIDEANFPPAWRPCPRIVAVAAELTCSRCLRRNMPFAGQTDKRPTFGWLALRVRNGAKSDDELATNWSKVDSGDLLSLHAGQAPTI